MQLTNQRTIQNVINTRIKSIWSELSRKGEIENRTDQYNLIMDIIENLGTKTNVICEAGVGIGKSYAYLMPGVLYSYYTKKPIVIITSTIQLSEQLESDVKQVAKFLKLDPNKVDAVVIKGQTNLLCKKELASFNISEKRKSKAWLEQEKQSKTILTNNEWKKVSVDSSKCDWEACEYYNECQFYKMRQKQKSEVFKDEDTEATVLIANMGVFTSHFSNRNPGFTGKSNLLPNEINYMVIDEIHNLESNVRAKFTMNVSDKTITDIFNASGKIIGAKDIYFCNAVHDVMEKLYNLYIHELEFEGDKKSVSFPNEISEELLNLINIALKFSDSLLNRIDQAKRRALITNYTELNTSSITESVENTINLLNGIKLPDFNRVYWIEIENETISLNSCPKNINQYIKNWIFNKESMMTIGVSATIASSSEGEKDYNYISENIGFEGRELDIRKSPFDYSKSRLFIPDNMPKNMNNLKDEDYLSAAKKIVQLSECINGGVLVLFTAKKDLLEISKWLQSDQIKLNRPVYVANESGMSSRQVLKNNAENRGIMLGTGTFWEGIDLKDDHLHLLILFKLPFPVPTPIIKHKIEVFDGEKDKVLIPEMITMLKQGTGRLIRKETDKGIIAILDSRMSKNQYKYKPVIFENIPIKESLKTFDEFKQFCKENNL